MSPKTNPVRLNLGSRERKIYGYLNIDIDPGSNPDLVEDIITLDSFEKESVDLIYCCHVAEHLSRKDSEKAFKRWYEVLKPNGILRISVPDIEACCKHYVIHRDLDILKCFFYGSQRNEHDFHLTGWDFNTLARDLYNVKFRNVHKYDVWELRKKEDFYIDDHSFSYLPHMDFKNGVLLSLNVQASK